MRAVFSVEIPRSMSGGFPTNDEFLNKIRAYGWEDIKLKDLPEPERSQGYKKLAEQLWEMMPEVPNAEKDYVIFYGVLPDIQTRFVITRITEGQATFRILHSNLAQLKLSIKKMIRRLMESELFGEPSFRIINRSVRIYERGLDTILIRGRVITSPLEEAWRVDKRNILLFVAAFVLAIPSFVSLVWINSSTNRILGGTLERLTTTLLAVMLVGVMGFLQTYMEVRASGLIHWSIPDDLEE